MPRTEFLYRRESKYHLCYEELLEESNARHIKNFLAGQLYQGEEYIIKCLKEEYTQ